MNRKLPIALACFIIMIALLFGYKAGHNFLQHYPRVRVAFVNQNDLYIDTELAGKVIADEIRDLYADMNVKVQKVWVQEGEPVSAGQALLRFDSDVMKLELAECQADIMQKEQELAAQKTDGFSQTGLKISEAGLQVLYLRKELLEKQIRELTVTAPITGRVSLLLPKPGEKIGAGTKIAQVIDERQLTIEAQTPANDGMKITIGNPAEVSFGNHTKSYAAEVFRILPPVRNPDNSYSDMRIRLRIVEPGVTLVPGSNVRVRVRIRIGRRQLAVTAPMEAIHDELTTVRGNRPAANGKRKYIFVLRNCSETLKPIQGKERSWMIRDNIYRARKVYVETGLTGVDRIEIVKGLKPFEQVIISSDRTVHDDDRVIVVHRNEGYKQP